MKILQIIARVNQGGTSHWIEQLVHGLRMQGHEVDLIAGYVQNGEIEDPSFEKLNGKRIENLGRSISAFSDLKALLEVRRAIKKFKPDLINTHTAKAGVIGRLAALSIKQNRPAVVHTYHGHLLYGYFNKFKTNIYVKVEASFARITDVAISAGELVRDELTASGIGNRDLFHVASPGVVSFKNLSKAEIRKSLDISNDQIVIGWIGRVTKIKRFDRVIALANTFPEILFLIGGSGDLLENYQSTAPQNIKFLGWIKPEIVWGASDIALLTSDNEAQPIALIEAGLCGLPSVAEGVGAVSEVVEDKLTGLLVNSDDERVAALKFLAADQGVRRTMGLAAKDYCGKKFSVEQFINSHISAYKSALEMHMKG